MIWEMQSLPSISSITGVSSATEARRGRRRPLALFTQRVHKCARIGGTHSGGSAEPISYVSPKRGRRRKSKARAGVDREWGTWIRPHLSCMPPLSAALISRPSPTPCSFRHIPSASVVVVPRRLVADARHASQIGRRITLIMLM